MINKMHYLDQYNNDITNIEIVYEELSKFINKNIDAKICAKINDISSFISKSIEDLERIAKSKGFDKNEAYIKPELNEDTVLVVKGSRSSAMETVVTELMESNSSQTTTEESTAC